MPKVPNPEQLQIVILVAGGYVYKEIAHMMGVTPSHVREQIKTLYEALGAHNASQAYRLLVEQGHLKVNSLPIPLSTIEEIVSRIIRALNEEAARDG